ncbi:MAG: hypothetical protein RLZZ58_1072 [Pseudomonadota bacterium]|jgi:hypothetical protein
MASAMALQSAYRSDAAPHDGGVVGAIDRAARATGVDFAYLLGQARIESGLNPDAKAPTSSATGLFQFIGSSWLDTVKRHGSDHGLGWAADAIRRGPGGHLQIADPALRRAVMDLRRDPDAASAMAACFARDNGDYLAARTGRPAAPVDLYLAHFLGPAGAAKFLAAHDANPDAPAAALFPAPAAANRNIFYDRSGAPRSLNDIRARFAAKLDGDAATPVSGAATPPARYVQPADYLRLAGQLASETESPRTAASTARRVADPAQVRLAYMLLAALGA